MGVDVGGMMALLWGQGLSSIMLGSLDFSVTGSMLKELARCRLQEFIFRINGFAQRWKWLPLPGNDRLKGWESTT